MCAQCPDLWVEVRLLLMCKSWYSKLTSSWTWSFVTYEKQEGLLQNKVTAILASVQRPGHWGHNCKMAYKCSSNCAMPTSRVKESTSSNLRWLNTVFRAVSGNSHDGMCFKLDHQTWRRKENWYTEDEFSNSTH